MRGEEISRVTRLIENEKYEKALDRLNSLSIQQPESHHLYTLTGYCHFSKGEHGKAMRYYDKSISLEPEDYRAYELKGRLLFSKMKFKPAGTLFFKAYENAMVGKKKIDLLVSSCFCYFLAKDQRAKAMLEKALEMDREFALDKFDEIFSSLTGSESIRESERIKYKNRAEMLKKQAGVS